MPHSQRKKQSFWVLNKRQFYALPSVPVFIYVSCSHTVHREAVPKLVSTHLSDNSSERSIQRAETTTLLFQHESATLINTCRLRHVHVRTMIYDSQFTIGPSTHIYGYLKQMHTQETELTMWKQYLILS